MVTPRRVSKPDAGDMVVLEEPQAYNVEPRWAATVGTMTVAAHEHARFGLVSLATLRAMARTFLPAAIISCRTNDVADYSQYCTDPMQPGWCLGMRDKSQRATRRDKKRMRQLADVFINGGGPYWDGGMDGFLRAITPQSLAFDRYTYEVIREKENRAPRYLVPVDPATIAKAIPTGDEGKSGRWYPKGDDVALMQVADNEVVAEFRKDQMGWGVRNANSQINRFAHGIPELEVGIPLITDILNIYIANSARSSAGLSPQALILFRSDASATRFEAIRRQVLAAMSGGPDNRRRSPVIQVDQTMKEDITVVPMHRPSSEVESGQQLALMTKYICALYDMDPSRINQLYGNEFQSNTISGGGSSKRLEIGRQQVRPILKNMAWNFNTTVVWPTDPKYCFYFTGTDPKSDKERYELYTEAVQWFMSPDEIRMEIGKDPWGDPISSRPLNGQYGAWAQQQMEGGGIPQPGSPEESMGFEDWLRGKRMSQ